MATLAKIVHHDLHLVIHVRLFLEGLSWLKA